MGKTAIAAVLLLAVWAGCGRDEAGEGVSFRSERAAQLVDHYLTGDWAAAQSLVDSIGIYEIEILETMEEQGLPQYSMDTFSYLVYRLQSLSRERTDPIRAGLAANQISSMLIGLESFSERRYPEALDRMRYLGRDIILLAQAPPDYGLMNIRLEQLENAWAGIRPEILERNAESLAAQVDQVISDLRERASDVRMVNGGNRILDLVEEMRVLYE